MSTSKKKPASNSCIPTSRKHNGVIFEKYQQKSEKIQKNINNLQKLFIKVGLLIKMDVGTK